MGLSRSEPRSPLDSAGIGLLSQAGMSSLPFSGVAARAGISTAGGRTWGTNFDRVVAVAFATMAAQHVPDTGALRTDVCDYLSQAIGAIREPEIRPVIIALLQASVEAPELTPSLRAVLVEPRRRELVEMVERACARGEVRAGRRRGARDRRAPRAALSPHARHRRAAWSGTPSTGWSTSSWAAWWRRAPRGSVGSLTGASQTRGGTP